LSISISNYPDDLEQSFKTASESLSVARFLDWAEVRLREVAQQSKDIWTRSSIPVKILISLIILGCIAAIEYGAYHLLFSGSKR
jgi:hypothetical protein